MVGGVAIGVVTLVEDVATGGVGILDDPTTFVISSGLVMTGAAMLSKGLKDRRPPEQQPVMGQGEKLPPLNIGDPGDLGGPKFKPPSPTPKAVTFIAIAGAAVIVKEVKEKIIDPLEQLEKEKQSVEEPAFKKGK